MRHELNCSFPREQSHHKLNWNNVEQQFGTMLVSSIRHESDYRRPALACLPAECGMNWFQNMFGSFSAPCLSITNMRHESKAPCVTNRFGILLRKKFATTLACEQHVSQIRLTLSCACLPAACGMNQVQNMRGSFLALCLSVTYVMNRTGMVLEASLGLFASAAYTMN